MLLTPLRVLMLVECFLLLDAVIAPICNPMVPGGSRSASSLEAVLCPFNPTVPRRDAATPVLLFVINVDLMEECTNRSQS